MNFALGVTNASITVSATGVSVSGPATLTITGSAQDTGTISASGSLSSLDASGNVGGNFTVTLGKGTLSGTVTFPIQALIEATASLSGTAQITGGTGAYAGYSSSAIPATGSTSGSITSMTVSFTMSGAMSTSGGTSTVTPTITAVLDNGSLTPNIAEGSLFVVKGSNICPSGTVFTSFPLPTLTSNDVKITFTPAAGGAGTDAYMIYTYSQGNVS